MSLPELRKKLRAAVRGEWAKPEMITAQEALSKGAEEVGIVGKAGHFGVCARGTTPIVECYAEKGPVLQTTYKRIWGKSVSS